MSLRTQIPVLKDSTAKGIAEDSRALSYIQVKANIDTIAQAIQDNNGCCIAFYFENNGTMRTEFIKPPINQTYAHWVYCGKVKMINGKKHIGFINSWGKRTGKDGWQWMSEDYFVNGNVWYGWTLAWDYKPAKIKLALKEVVRLLQALYLLKK